MLEMLDIKKTFPGVVALNGVSISMKEGEIHGLIGENGAGKSTLIKILGGIYQDYSGSIRVDGEEARFSSYKDALERGIALVNQDIQVVPSFSIAENLLLDKLQAFRNKFGFFDWKSIYGSASEYLKMVELDADPKANIASLSIAKKQLIQIAKALATNAAYLILDEPTSSLTEKESETLFSLLGGLKAKGVSILFVSHKLEEVLAICDRISVIRDGNMIATVDRESVTKESIISMMIGRTYFDSDVLKGEIKPGETMLEAVGICKKGLFKNIDFNVRSGEIVGFYGLVGAGRTEIARCVIGDYLIDSGEIQVGGKAAQIKSISDSFSRYKIGYITENRKEGIFLKKSNRWNISIAAWKKMRGKVLKTISSKKERTLCDDTVRDLSIRISGLSQRTEELSGGNQQKISFAKWLAAGCDILIIDEPTIGVDVMAKDVIHALIWKLAVEKGKTIVLITSDLDELLKLAMRIYVVRDGAIVGKNQFQDPRSADKQRLSNWIGQLLT